MVRAVRLTVVGQLDLVRGFLTGRDTDKMDAARGVLPEICQGQARMGRADIAERHAGLRDDDELTRDRGAVVVREREAREEQDRREPRRSLKMRPEVLYHGLYTVTKGAHAAGCAPDFNLVRCAASSEGPMLPCPIAPSIIDRYAIPINSAVAASCTSQSVVVTDDAPADKTARVRLI